MKLILIALLALSPLVKADTEETLTPEMIMAAQQAADYAAEDGDNIQGSYIARFSTLNAHVVGSIPGSAHIRRDEKKIAAFVRLFAGSPSVAHFQNVHAGTRCPTITDDLNFDGYIDYEEMIAVVGPVIIPLDEDISSQLGGNRVWPKAFENGSYDYLKDAKFKKFWKDLKSKDKDIKDHISKLLPEKGLAITGNVIVIQGVSEDKNLPATVKARPRYKAWHTLPIVCGVFKPVATEPGTYYVERIPGPIAPVEVGQDHPATIGPDQINPDHKPSRRDRRERDRDREDDNDSGWRWPWET